MSVRIARAPMLVVRIRARAAKPEQLRLCYVNYPRPRIDWLEPEAFTGGRDSSCALARPGEPISSNARAVSVCGVRCAAKWMHSMNAVNAIRSMRNLPRVDQLCRFEPPIAESGPAAHMGAASLAKRQKLDLIDPVRGKAARRHEHQIVDHAPDWQSLMYCDEARHGVTASNALECVSSHRRHVVR